jgi:serine/threonine protein kinase
MKIEKYYENHACLSIASERYYGKELFDQIVARGVYKEKDAALIVGQIVSAVSYLHDRNIVHRDIKPENILFKTSDPSSDIVLIDFGTATYHLKHIDEPLEQEIGSPSYVAPEVLRQSYDSSCDMWSVGVVMYILLCGEPPFPADTDKEILKKVRNGEYTMKQPEWNNISEGKYLTSPLPYSFPCSGHLHIYTHQSQLLSSH